MRRKLGVVLVGFAALSVFVVATALARHRASHARLADQVRLAVARSVLSAGQAVPVTIVNDGSVPILRDICFILERQVGGRWETITRTHGVDVKCPPAGIPQRGHSHQTVTLPLFDDLVPGPYRVTLIYKPISTGAVGRLSGRGERFARTQITIRAFRRGPKPRLAERRIRKIAQAAAARAGDPHPTLIQHSEGTRFEANRIASGDLVFNWQWSYLIAERGHFVSNRAPPGAKPPSGTVTLVVDAATGQGTDSGISDRYPHLATLGPVTTDLRRPS
jgi:hypothetical protein